MSPYSLVPGFIVRWMARRAATARSGFWRSVAERMERDRGPGWQDKLPDAIRP